MIGMEMPAVLLLRGLVNVLVGMHALLMHSLPRVAARRYRKSAHALSKLLELKAVWGLRKLEVLLPLQ